MEYFIYKNLGENVFHPIKLTISILVEHFGSVLKTGL